MDNFFSKDDLAWVEGAMEYGLSNIKKDYPYFFDTNGIVVSGNKLLNIGCERGMFNGNFSTNGFSCFVPFWNTERYIDVIYDLWEEALDIYDYKRNNNIKRKDFFSFLELNIYPPGLEYHWHTDVDYKSFSGVCYIGEEGNGTTLKSGSNEIDVVWKHNRGIFFVNCDEKRRALNIGKDVYTSHHKYVNKTNKPRFAVNFNMIHPDNIGQTMSKMHSRKFEKLFHPKNFRKPRPYNKFEIILLGIK